MPRRLTPLVSDYIYHVYNHGIDERDIFTSKHEYRHFLLALWFYQPLIIPFRLSEYFSLSTDLRLSAIQEINTNKKAVKIHAYCLMSNHFHLLIEQISDTGISKFMANIQNCYTRYFNIRHDRKGPLFLTGFKTKLIHNEEQFLHVSRYIHLNPYSAHVVKTLNQLKSFPYCSIQDYFNGNIAHPVASKERIEHYFKSQKSHWEFIADHADYQRQMAHISHLIDE